jgi:hypothetical protein
MKKRYWVLMIIGSLFVGYLIGTLATAESEIVLFGKYDLYNCIQNNAHYNGFNQNPIMIKEIQQECVCLFVNNCSSFGQCSGAC